MSSYSLFKSTSKRYHVSRGRFSSSVAYFSRPFRSGIAIYDQVQRICSCRGCNIGDITRNTVESIIMEEPQGPCNRVCASINIELCKPQGLKCYWRFIKRDNAYWDIFWLSMIPEFVDKLHIAGSMFILHVKQVTANLEKQLMDA